jgi:hypothetical protein
MKRLALLRFGHGFPRVPTAILFALLLVLMAVLVPGRHDFETGPPALADLVSEIAAGRPEAVSRAKRAAARDWPAAAPVVSVMLGHDDARVRAAACIILADHLDGNGLYAVWPRASDADWRVRMAAFQALAAAQPLGGEVLRDTPLDEREAVLLQWLDACVKSTAAGGPELCELYADDRHVEFGRPLAARCLACHAGAEPAPFAANDVCAGCHAAAYVEWAASAHGQSLSHLHLATVNPDTRQPEQMNFGEVRGIGCRGCHRVEKEPAAPPTDAAGLTACPFCFRADAKPADACRRCHASTHRQWEAWLKGPQPRIASWPPGQIETDRRGDTRTCVDCHMAARAADGATPGRTHSWSARRDVRRLREGISVAIAASKDAAAPAVEVTLVNLSGHAYPTGTRRRALRIVAGPPGDGAMPGESAQAVVADLSPVRPGRPLFAAEPALAPGEQRALPLPVPAGARALVCRIFYCRDACDPQAFVTEIWQAEQDLRPWHGPRAAEAAK